MSNFAMGNTESAEAMAAIEEEEDEETSGKLNIEEMLKMRIADRLFDDVTRKKDLPPSTQEKAAEEEGLDFEKSRVGLGDVYAKQFAQEVFGAEKNPGMEKAKVETMQLFATVMYKLDSLTNSTFTPRPPTVTPSGARAGDLAAIRVEAAVPMRHPNAAEEMDREERHALRRAKKH